MQYQGVHKQQIHVLLKKDLQHSQKSHKRSFISINGSIQAKGGRQGLITYGGSSNPTCPMA
jgi:hypothetical protein